MLSQLSQTIIDATLKELLEIFYLLPPKDAMAALNQLTQLPLMPEDEKEYPRMPALFHGEIYQPKAIQESLQRLCEIMYNRQPQKAMRSHANHGLAVCYGIFGLANRDRIITEESIHAYMRHQFALTELTISAFSIMTKIANTWREKHKSLYYKHLANWIIDGGEMTSAMQSMLNSKDILETTITKNFKPNGSHITAKDVYANLFTLSPSIIDPETTETLEKLLGLKIIINAIKQDSYTTAFDKITKQITAGDTAFTQVDAVSQSLALVVQGKKAIYDHGGVLDLCEGLPLATTIEAICDHYIAHLNQNPPVQQIALTAAETAEIQQFLTGIRTFLQEEKIEWCRDLFAMYFFGDRNDREQMLKIAFNLFFQGKLHADDAWLQKVFKDCGEIERGSRVVNFTPYHVNCILMHAFSTPTQQWTDLFASTLDMVVNLINNNAENSHLTLQYKQNSYPERLRDQLTWLITFYKKEQNLSTEEPGEQPISHFPMLSFPRTFSNLWFYFQFVPQKQFLSVLDRSKNSLPLLINTAPKLNWLLRILTDEQFVQFWPRIADHAQSLVNNKFDYTLLFCELTPAEMLTVRSAFENHPKKNELPKRSVQKLNELFCDLDAVQLDFLLRLASGELTEAAIDLKESTALSDWSDICSLLSNVPSDYCKKICGLFNDSISTIISTPHAINRLFNKLNSHQREAVFSCVKANLPNIIHDWSDFYSVIKHLDNTADVAYVCNAIKDNASDIKTRKTSTRVTIDFTIVIKNVSKENLRVICDVFKDSLHLLINSSDSFNIILDTIDPDQGRVLCAKLVAESDKLAEIIEDSIDFDRISENLADKQQVLTVYEACKDHWLLFSLIRTKRDFIDFVESHQIDKDTVFKDLLKSILQQYIKNRKARKKQSSFFNRFNDAEKIAAATHLVAALETDSKLDAKDIRVLTNGSLAEKIKSCLEIADMSLPLGKFLKNYSLEAASRPRIHI